MALSGPPRRNEMFGLLTHSYRRYVLYYLTNESGTVDITSLSTAISNWGSDLEPIGRNEDRSDIELALHHTHLPKLADAGIILYDTTSRRVELSEAAWGDRFLAETALSDEYLYVASRN